MAYTGNVELIDGIKPKNNNSFPLVNAHDVYVDDETRLDAALEGIGGSIDEALDNAVRVDKAQTFTDAQKAQALANVGGASEDEIGKFLYSQFAASRRIFIYESVKTGDLLYFKPIEWTGDTYTRIILQVEEDGTYVTKAQVNQIGDESFWISDGNYEVVTIGVLCDAAPSEKVSFKCIYTNCGNLDSLSKYVISNLDSINDINDKIAGLDIAKYLKNGYGFGNPDQLYAPFDNFNTIPIQTVASYNSSALTAVLNKPFSTWTTVITTGFQTNETNRSGSFQIATEVHTGNVAYRPFNTQTDPLEWIYLNLPIYVNRSGWHRTCKAYTTFKSGIEEAVKRGNCTVHVDDGTYNLLDEFGSEWLESYSESKACGCLLGNNVTIEFATNAKLIAKYNGSNDLIKQYFSPINITGSFKLINAKIDVSNVRYCVHEDITTITDIPNNYTGEYIDCIMIHNGNNLSGWTSNFCLGCGATPNGITKIIGGSYTANNSRHIPIFWHNSGSDTGNSYVKIEGITLGKFDHFHFRRGAENGNTVNVTISNCLYDTDISYADGAPDKFNISLWSNPYDEFNFKGYISTDGNANNLTKQGWWLIAKARISGITGLPDELTADAILTVYPGNLTIQVIREISYPYNTYQRYLYSNNQNQSIWIKTPNYYRKKVAYIFGDSITRGTLGDGGTGTSYLELAMSKQGYTVKNCGVGGIGYVYSAAKSTDQVDWNTGGGRLRAQDVVNHYASELVQADTVIIAYGINDWQTLGDSTTTIAESDRRATSSNITANVKTLIETVYNANKNARIIVVTPLNTSFRGGSISSKYALETSLNNNNDGKEDMTLEKVYQAIVSACNYYGVKYIDMTHNNSVINYLNVSNMLPDKLHPSQNTYHKLADEIKI